MPEHVNSLDKALKRKYGLDNMNEPLKSNYSFPKRL
ncbi:hypothetical protein ACFSCX_09785 [Bacillus salitolerans]|uniref:Uncharacterized protein n=1 Tax=Bacillus salitolerans TaxID=1437434 RepID=A0ABW4LRT8_9BACI